MRRYSFRCHLVLPGIRAQYYHFKYTLHDVGHSEKVFDIVQCHCQWRIVLRSSREAQLA